VAFLLLFSPQRPFFTLLVGCISPHGPDDLGNFGVGKALVCLCYLSLVMLPKQHEAYDEDVTVSNDIQQPH
jgi:hypothetical protein